MEKPSYYAIIPSDVRYAEIKANAKLLYGELTALSNKYGYCFATNNYFAQLYGVGKNTISLWVSELKKHNFITIEIKRNDKNQIVERRIGIIKLSDRGIFKNDENNKIKFNTINDISIRRMKFGTEVSEKGVGILEIKESNKFLDYWTEENKSGTKMRFEMERTFDIRRRLTRWKDNSNKWSQSKPTMSKLDIQLNEYQKGKDLLRD